MKIIAVVWQSYYNMLYKASKSLKDLIDIEVHSARALDLDYERFEKVLKDLEKADLIFLYRSNEPIWETLEKKIKQKEIKAKVICLGHDPSYWLLSNVSTQILSKTYKYLLINGEKNLINMFKFLLKETLNMEIDYEEPEEIPWEALYHPEAKKLFKTVDEYLSWYKNYWGEKKSRGTIGILFSRHYWINGNTELEDVLIKEFEKRNFKVISGFAYSVKDESLGTKGSGEVVLEWFLDKKGNPRIDGFVKLISFFLGTSREKSFDSKETAFDGIEILKNLNVPCFSPVSSYYKTIEEWEKEGLNLDIGWSIALPEFEGVIEPIIVSAQVNGEADERKRMPIFDRIEKLVSRIERWVELRKIPSEKRRIAFVLHNNPCASVEATVGAAAHLDSLESVVQIMQKMKRAGYKVENIPESGKALVEKIMQKKAISEFRWTTVEEIVEKGGAIDFVSVEKYLEWFSELPESTQKRMCEAWGNPPGEWKEGIPPAMVYDGKIVITGLRFGNVTVHVQPKRGCAGARCDGRVCKILHDPDVPPPHQYIATYKWISKEFKAHAIVHVGTHGNLEFLPGKGVALSSACFPDISIDTIPHLYIYNSDNPPEGTIAKRRSYAVLVDHMQTVMTGSGIYDELEELERLIGEYEETKLKDPAKLHALQHLILQSLKKSNLDKEIKIKWQGKRVAISELTHEDLHKISFDSVVKEVHERLSLIRNTQIQDGMHIFGRPPEGDRRADFIYAILRYDAGKEISLRREIAKLLGYDLKDLLQNQDRFDPKFKKSYGAILEEIDKIGKEVIKEVLKFEKQGGDKFECQRSS
ncbi:MAG: cobaltochelatase subunit CobN [Thermodesulfobacterium sp.]|nr:cobaltochelatase subunit CobN [Thermodesulfobacterium sp.]